MCVTTTWNSFIILITRENQVEYFNIYERKIKYVVFIRLIVPRAVIIAAIKYAENIHFTFSTKLTSKNNDILLTTELNMYIMRYSCRNVNVASETRISLNKYYC